MYVDYMNASCMAARNMYKCNDLCRLCRFSWIFKEEFCLSGKLVQRLICDCIIYLHIYAMKTLPFEWLVGFIDSQTFWIYLDSLESFRTNSDPSDRKIYPIKAQRHPIAETRILNVAFQLSSLANHYSYNIIVCSCSFGNP